MDSRHTSEAESLLDPRPAPARANWFNRLLTTVKGIFGYAIHHPVTTLLAMVTAAPNTVNALVGPSGVSPAKLGSAWWNNMTLFQKMYSIGCAGSSFTINAIINALFLPLAWTKFRTGIGNIKQGPVEASKSIASIILGTFAGVAAFAIGYYAFMWLPYGKVSALPIALSNLTINFASRFISIVAILSAVSVFVSSVARKVRRYAEQLEHLHPRHLPKVERELQEILGQLFPDADRSLTTEEYQAVVQALIIKLNALQQLHPDLLKTPTTAEYARSYAKTLSSLTFAFIVACSGFVTFTQKGFDGINIFSMLTSDHNLEDLPATGRACIGMLSGIATFMFYANNSFNFIHNMTTLTKHLYREPQHIPKALLIFATNGLACISMTTVARGVADNPHNIFGITDNAFKTLFITDTTIGGALANTNSSIEKALLPTRIEPDVNEIKVADIIHYLRNAPTHTITPHTVALLHQHGLFYTHVQDENTPNEIEMEARLNPYSV